MDVTATRVREGGAARGGEADGAPGSPPPLAGLRAVLDDLERAGVAYCAWKSNSHLADALAGRTDLDLLVDRQDAARLAELLARHDLRRLEPSPGGRHAGVEHHLGMDRATTRLFHLHVHHRIVLGERHVKNVVLPLDEAFLGPRRWMTGVRLPPPAVELTVLGIRALLKVRARDLVKDTLRIRTHGVPGHIRDEVRWLLAQVDVGRVRPVCGAARLGTLAGVLEEFLRRTAADERFGPTLWRMRRTTRRLLRDHARRSRAGVWAETVRVVLARRTWRRGAPHRRMTPAVGGSVIALVGPDGAGKSTFAADLVDWLGWKLDVRAHYLGSKQPSRPSRALHLAFRALRRATRTVAGGRGRLARPLGWLRDVVLAAHCLSIGRDRVRRHRRGRAAAQDGRVVVLDRFPVASCTGNPRHRVLDGPRIDVLLPDGGGLVARLARRERALYARVGSPDLVVALEVAPATALARKPDHDLDVLGLKALVTRELVASPGGLRVVAVPTDGDLEQVRRAVRRVVWDAL